jgi:PAS domain S-box-containing protein
MSAAIPWLVEVLVATTSGRSAVACARSFAEAVVRAGAARRVRVLERADEAPAPPLAEAPSNAPASQEPTYEDVIEVVLRPGEHLRLEFAFDAAPAVEVRDALEQAGRALANVIDHFAPGDGAVDAPWGGARFLESVIENIPDMIFVKDAAELRFVRFNAAGERLLGWPRERLLGKNDHDFFPPDEAAFFTAKDREVLASRNLVEIAEEPIHTASGTRFLHTKKIPIVDATGIPAFLLGISEDITEKKLAREALRAQEERFRNLFRSAPVSLWELDASACLPDLEVLRHSAASLTVRIRRIFESLVTLSINDETLALFGAPNAETVQARLPELLGMGRHGGSLVEALVELTCGTETVEREISGQRLDGRPLHLLMRLTVPPGANADLRYVLLSLTDVSALKDAEAALTQAAEELRRSNAELQQFAYVASHDLQEPLRVITGFSDLLRKSLGGQLTGESAEFLEFIVDAAARMQRLIRDLLAYARVGTAQRRRELVGLSGPLGDALANLRLLLEETGAQVIVRPEPLPAAPVDPLQLTQVFQNLIGNALKFRSTAAPRIEIDATATPASVLIVCRDNGIGFDPQYRERIFEVFQRLHGHGRYPGTGIGLALCRKIIEQHGGSISADATPGHGAVFQFNLPGSEGPR